jgi:type VI secretion system protein
MRERRLLERIAGGAQSGERTSQTSIDMLVRSVIEHLRRLLNTRQGSVQIDPLFGIPDFTNIAGGLSAGSMRDIEEEICRMVRKYEQRLQSPKVSLNLLASDALSINFSLRGTLDVDNRAIPLQLSTIVKENGKVHISHA